MADELFSVYQFFRDNTRERVSACVGPADAVMTAQRLTENVGGRIASTRRVIITDSGDNTVFEWIFGKGVTFPTPRRSR